MTTPVLFLIFNRPDTTRIVFEAIRREKPDTLYIASDGPRNKEEKIVVEETRKIAASVDWDCKVKRLFRDENLGCRVAVSTALDWFFENEEEGIILEDDCLPSRSFFKYCTDLLNHFRDNERIMCVSGNNFQQGRKVTEDSYYFSKYSHCWGWATWRRAWHKYDRDMHLWPAFFERNGLDPLADSGDGFKSYWVNIFNEAAQNRIDSWDYQWLFTCWENNGVACLPERNLVKNIGFGSGATHTEDGDHWMSRLTADDINFPLRHPKAIIRNEDADRFTDQVCFGIGNYQTNTGGRSRIIRRLISIGKRVFHRG